MSWYLCSAHTIRERATPLRPETSLVANVDLFGLLFYSVMGALREACQPLGGQKQELWKC